VVGSDRSPGRGTRWPASGGGLLLFSGNLAACPGRSRKARGNGPSVVLSTLCMVHNRLSSITPFHKFGLRILMASAVAADRL
jgi:hypothetical protein